MWVQIPRTVQIRDWRINLLYYACFISLGAFLTTVMVKNKAWVRMHGRQSDILVSPFVTGSSVSTIKHVTEKAKGSAICVNSEDFWYDWLVGSRWVYRPTGCLTVCLSEDTDPNVVRDHGPCVPQENLYMRDYNSVFIPTLLQFTSTAADGRLSESVVFSPYAEHISISFWMSVVSSVPYWKGLSMSQYDTRGKSGNGLITVVVDFLGRVDSVWDKTAEFTVGQILKLCCGDDYLDQTNTAVRMNTNVSQKRSYPTVRTTGLQVDVLIDCTNDIPQLLEAAEQFSEWSTRMDGNVSTWCTLRFVAQDLGRWGVRERSRQNGVGMDQTTDVAYFLGVKLNFVKTLAIPYTDLKTTAVWLGSACVFLRWPNYLIYVFITCCLGPLSFIYRRAISQDFSISQAVVEVAARLVGAGRYKTVSLRDETEEVMGKTQVAAQLAHLASEFHEFNEMSSAIFGYFISRTLEKEEVDKMRNCKHFFNRDRPCAESIAITMRTLLDFHEKLEDCTLRHAMCMFSVNRRISMIEKMFAPPLFLEALRHVKDKTSPGNASPDLVGVSIDEDRTMLGLMPKSSTQPKAGQEKAEEGSPNFHLEQRWELHRTEVLQKFDRLEEVIENVLARLTRLEAGFMTGDGGAVAESSNSPGPSLNIDAGCTDPRTGYTTTSDTQMSNSLELSNSRVSPHVETRIRKNPTLMTCADVDTTELARRVSLAMLLPPCSVCQARVRSEGSPSQAPPKLHETPQSVQPKPLGCRCVTDDPKDLERIIEKPHCVSVAFCRRKQRHLGHNCHGDESLYSESVLATTQS
eukprot:TRINITY_DN17906_c0_g1_i1.p1 TRINITY_DN17906_c0_g1~~TRINITY_DN17906_c0_g1_i1.p1  ORF type:complete len:801 (+),score=75.73 TRINITY_DN17906_c0_g1_i1:271-2673(+)